jgi:hypothetical protein
MDGPASWLSSASRVLGALLLCELFSLADVAKAQAPAPVQGQPPAKADGRKNGPGAGQRDAKARRKQAQDPARAQLQPRGEPSADYQESLRRTIERRRERRARRGQAQGNAAASAAIGAIVPWPMPPALIIRHTPAVHDEVGAFLYGLRH